MLFQLAEITAGSDFNIVSLVTQIGFSGIFLWQWLDATKERRAAQQALSTLFERLLPVLEECTSTLERVQTSMSKQVDRAEKAIPAGPSPDDMNAAIRRLERLSDEITTDLRQVKRRGD